jgi:DNA modification methylase
VTTPTHRVECADALAFLRSLPDASVAAVITDPPYGTNDGKGKRGGAGGGAAVFA